MIKIYSKEKNENFKTDSRVGYSVAIGLCVPGAATRADY